MKTRISRAVTTALTSRAFRNIRRGLRGLRRRLSGGRPTVHYFHQADDPYSHIASQTLGAIAARYDVTLVPWIVSPPDDAAAPERERLRHYALRDAPRLAAQYGLSFPGNAALPENDLLRAAQSALTGAREKNFTVAPAIGDALWRGDAAALKALAGDVDAKAVARALAEGDALRKKLGHYLGAMFYFEGEWYWGVDRLNHLEERLAGLGLDRKPGTPMIAPWRDAKLGPAPKCRTKPVIEYWFSFRSPYSWISFPRMRKIARHYGADLQLRFILPMVMRGLPVPPVKRIYITLDTKREAERAGIPYGTIVDPVGPGAARALAVLHHAVKLGRGEDFAELGLRAAFADGIDLASDRGLVDVARRAGLDEKTVKAALADESWRPIAETNREALFAAGLWGAPSFRVDGMPAHWGQDRFWALEEDILRAIEIRNASES